MVPRLAFLGPRVRLDGTQLGTVAGIQKQKQQMSGVFPNPGAAPKQDKLSNPIIFVVQAVRMGGLWIWHQVEDKRTTMVIEAFVSCSDADREASHRSEEEAYHHTTFKSVCL